VVGLRAKIVAFRHQMTTPKKKNNMETIGRYQIKAELGRGGMAVVYRALDPNIGREVALKLMSREFLADPEFHHRFLREARAIGALESSAIVPLYDFGEDKGQPYLVMRLMTGGSLVDKLRQGAMSLEAASQLLTRLAEALDEAHSKGIIHRDLKPGNILLDHKGDAYLADFGIVKLLESSSMTSRGAIGTPAYMSPEHFEGEVSAQSDIYALGVITFQILTAKLPFQARSPSEWLKAHLMDKPLSLRQVNGQLPVALEAVIQRALAKKPEDRFQSAGELARAVSQSASQPVSQSASQRSASQPVSQSASQRSASGPVSQSASQRPASQPISQSASQRYENKPTVLNTPPPGVVSRPSSQPISQPVTKPPQGMPWGWLMGAAMLGLMGCGLMVVMGLWLNSGSATVAIVPTATPKPAATWTATFTPEPAATWTPTNTPQKIADSPTDTPIQATETAVPPTDTPIPPSDTLTELPGSDPMLTEPQNGSTVTNNNDPIFLRWSGRELNGAKGEQFMVSIRNGKGENITLPNKGITQNSEYALPHDLAAGPYSWLVVVQKKGNDGNYDDVNRSKVSSFTLSGATVAVQPPAKVEATPITQKVTAPTNTPTVMVTTKRAAVGLMSPPNGDAFAGREAIIELRWAETLPALAADEYYVLIINHKGGEDRTWLKTNSYALSKEKNWLADMGPDLRWQVVVAQKQTTDPNEDPRGAERSEWSEEYKFTWTSPGQSAGGGGGSSGSSGSSSGGGDGGSSGGGGGGSDGR